MKIDKATNRDKKSFKKKHGMRVSGKSVFTIQKTIIKKSRNQESKRIK